MLSIDELLLRYNPELALEIAQKSLEAKRRNLERNRQTKSGVLSKLIKQSNKRKKG